MFGSGGGKRRIGRAVTGLVLTGATGLVGAGHGADHDPADVAKRLRPESSPTVTASPTPPAKPSRTTTPSPAPSRTRSARPHEHAAHAAHAAHQAKRAASLRISKSVTPNPMIIGAESVYTVTVRNTGDEAATGVTVTDTLDSNVTAGSPSGDCSAPGSTVTCGGPGTTVPAGGTVTYEIPVTVDPSVSDGTNITNRASVNSANGGSDSTQLISQTQTLTDVEITKTGPATAHPDGTITYTITVTNHGPSDAVDVTVQDETNGNLTSITGRPDACNSGGLTVSCSLGTLTPGQTRTLTLTLKVNSDVATGTEIPNCAKVYTGSRENNTDDNQSCTTTTVDPDTPTPAPLADVHVVKSGPAVTRPDGTVTYTVVVTNEGDSDATDVTIHDPDNGLDEFTGLPSQCADNGGRVTCSLGTIAAHDSVTLTFTAHVNAGAEPGAHIVNCATATTTAPETDRRDDISCADTTVEASSPTPTTTPTEPTSTPTTTPTSPGPSPTGTAPHPTTAPGTHPGPPGGPPPGHRPALPFTGTPLAFLALGAAALIIAGVTARALSRRE